MNQIYGTFSGVCEIHAPLTIGERCMGKCMYCDTHFKLCHNGKSKIFLQKCGNQNKSCALYVSRETAEKRKKQIEELDCTKR